MSHAAESSPFAEPRITLLLGGVRAGKSARALVLAQTYAGTDNVLFVATAQPFDDEMRERIKKHRAERPHEWHTVESHLDLAADIEANLLANAKTRVVVVDCLTLWVSNVLLTLHESENAEQVLAARTSSLLRIIGADADSRATRREAPRRWIIVSNEVGLGIVPPTPLGRRYRDALGRANQLVAAAADRVSLLVAGLELSLK
jgi:adenosylcobinamide kinase/adenosylcobinamide-phosphate guanylyltransferase